MGGHVRQRHAGISPAYSLGGYMVSNILVYLAITVAIVAVAAAGAYSISKIGAAYSNSQVTPHPNVTGYGTGVYVHAGQRISNFIAKNINYNTLTVSGLLYVEYPVASTKGVNTTIGINSTVGYRCDNTAFELVAIYPNETALFIPLLNTSTYGGCPI